jgi:hypothetical protein
MTARPERDGALAGGKGKHLQSGSAPAHVDLAAEGTPGNERLGEELLARQEALIDEALEETFPASDSIAPMRIIGQLLSRRPD